MDVMPRSSAVLVLLAAALLGFQEPPAPKPNILFIFSDDQSYKTVGCYP